MTQDKPHSYSEEKEVTFLDDIYTLLLINDDFNTFDFVIDALIELCHHTYEQAYQCTLSHIIMENAILCTGLTQNLKL